MIQNWKFHALALSIICALIVVLYAFFAPEPPAPVQDPNMLGDRAIEIYSASWGMECNSYIKDLMAAPRKDIKDEPLKLEYAVKDNALMKVGEVCNGKNSCDVMATNELLELKILDTCSKKLDIAYRCYSYDRLWNLTINQGATKKIDCNAATPAPAK